MIIKYQIEGMHCAGCSNNLENAINKLSEVKKANVNLISNELTVIFKKEVNHDIIIKTVIERGFKAKIISDEEFIGITRKKTNYKDLIKLLVSAHFLVIIFSNTKDWSPKSQSSCFTNCSTYFSFNYCYLFYYLYYWFSNLFI